MKMITMMKKMMTVVMTMKMTIMTVIIQRRDKRLREEFLRLPAPPGIGYKSSRILGLEESYLQVPVPISIPMEIYQHISVHGSMILI